MSNPIDELLKRTIPEKLWHYTSIQGFQGIVASKSVWATDLRFLNDREEFIHARNIANKIVSATAELDANGFLSREFLAKAVTLAFDSGPLANSQVFVASFSAAEDQLGQWRAYSHGSSGVSLAFDLKAFRPPADTGTLVSFAPCVYDLVEKEELVLHALHHFREEVGGYRERAFKAACDLNPEKRMSKDKEQVVKEFLEANPSKKAPSEDFQAAVIKTRIDCLRIAALLKHSSFEEESEWRLVFPTLMDRAIPMNNPPRFRAEKTTLIPYIAHPFSAVGPLPLVDIILGPGSDENSVFAARRFLKSQDLNLEPRLSKVPYRAS
jgi:Protein of unknown function (DUF2971)